MADQLTYVVPVSPTHLEKPVPFDRLFVQIPVTDDVRKRKAAFPIATPSTCVKFK